MKGCCRIATTTARRIRVRIRVQCLSATATVGGRIRGGQQPKLGDHPISQTDGVEASVSALLGGQGVLSDVFKIPEPPRIPSPGAYPREAFEQYSEIVEHIINEDPKFRKTHTKKPLSLEAAAPVIKWLRSDAPTLPCNLPTLERALKGGDDPRDVPGDFKEEIMLQQERFRTHLGLDSAQFKMAEGALIQTMNLSARNARGRPAEVVWQKTKEAGFTSLPLLTTLLYVSSTLSIGCRRKHSKYSQLLGGSILDVLMDDDNQQDTDENVDTTDEIAVYHDLLHKPTEQSINVRVRLLVAQGKAEQAEELLKTHTDDLEIRLRSYTPVLRLYLELGQEDAALRLYKAIRESSAAHLETDTYVHLLAGLVRLGSFHPSRRVIKGVKKLGFAFGAGPGLFDCLVSEMASTVYEISAASTNRLYNSFVEGFPSAGLIPTRSMIPLKITDTPAGKSDLIVSRVTVDPRTGFCRRSGVTLQLITLTDEQISKLKASLYELSIEQQKKHGDRIGTPHEERADIELRKFDKWLNAREGRPYTVVVDGANVGYYLQNFEGGRFSFHQIKFVVDSLERKGENVLVILPARYRKNRFFSTIDSQGQRNPATQVLSDSEIAARDDLLRRGKIYFVHAGMLDDFYWILASVSEQTNSRKGRDLSVAADNEEGRWPGTRPVLVTNDQMRDHRLGMMEPKLFRRWFSNYIVNYHFAAFVNGGSMHPEIGFSPACFFSREIQNRIIPEGSTVWHFPISETENEWFCIRIPKKINGK